MVAVPESVKKWVPPLAGLGVGFFLGTRVEALQGGPIAAQLQGFIGPAAIYAEAGIYAVVGWVLFSVGGLIMTFVGAIFFGLALVSVLEGLGVIAV